MAPRNSEKNKNPNRNQIGLNGEETKKWTKLESTDSDQMIGLQKYRSDRDGDQDPSQ
jgi:hypothetical protein